MNAVMQDTTPLTFDRLGLSAQVLQAVTESGYEQPSPIQARMIPYVLDGKDVIGQAQTGTGKTAAFALPILSKIDVSKRALQALVLAPTRELAMQVCQSFQRYAAHLNGFKIAPIYGGKGYAEQLRALREGVHVIVGTPGRVIDHIRSGKLSLAEVSTLVLDEADEMLRMGFIDDVEWILSQTPERRQIALFSATMPRAIRQIAQQHLSNPVEIAIEAKTVTAPLIRQRFWMASGLNKLDALTRILEQKHSDGVIVFVRTKSATVELADSLIARGFAAVAINGDLAQRQREQTIKQLKSGQIDILVATDVAARGLDVERISHVINYDIPTDPESYIHRIGRTGRAGREGEAVLFVSPREMRMVSVIERATHQRIEKMELPTIAEINLIRMRHLKDTLNQTIAEGGLELFIDIASQLKDEFNHDPLLIAAAFAKMNQGGRPLLLKEPVRTAESADDTREERSWRGHRHQGHSGGMRRDRPRRFMGERKEGGFRPRRPAKEDNRRSERARDDRPKDAHTRDDRPRVERPRNDRPRTDRPRTDRPRSERQRDDRRSDDRQSGFRGARGKKQFRRSRQP